MAKLPADRREGKPNARRITFGMALVLRRNPRVLSLRAGFALSLVAFALPAALPAQQPVALQPQWEGRFVSVLSPSIGAMGGAGMNIRAGWYARLGLALTAGAVRDGDAWASTQRIEATARFMFDPFAERRRGFYAGAGIGAEHHADRPTRGLLLGVVGVEGAATGSVVPAIELTLGGGARLGIVLRARRLVGR